MNDGRLAGLIDWNSITDRTRHLEALPHWESPREIVSECAKQFNLEKWLSQPLRIEVWIEKDALVGVIESACRELDVPYFSCRGYTSQSELWRAAMRLRGYEKTGQETLVLHMGDHDPSGIDMTRDIQDRLRLFGAMTEVRRIALNEDQIAKYGPPPNPAKTTDSRYADYALLHGEDSWELDALEPRVLSDLVEHHIRAELDEATWSDIEVEEANHRKQLELVSENWDDVVEGVENA